MNVVDVNPVVDPLWERLVHLQRSDVFHSPGWLHILETTYGFEPHALVATGADNAPIAGVPYCRVEDMLGGRVVTLPFSDYCDPLVTSQDQWDLLAGRILSTQGPATLRCLHNQLPLHDARFTVHKRAKWHCVDLQSDPEVIWRRLAEPARRAIRKARQSGFTVRMADSEDDLRAFFTLHLNIRKRKYRLLAQPYRFFQAIWEHIMVPGAGRLMVACSGDEIVSGVLFLDWKDTLYYKFNASHPDYLMHRPNDLLMWEGIRYGVERGFTRLDLGLSDWDEEGLLRYKRKYATEEKTIWFLRGETGSSSNGRHVGQIRDLLSHLTDLLTDDSVSDDVTSRAGDLLYRFFV